MNGETTDGLVHVLTPEDTNCGNLRCGPAYVNDLHVRLRLSYEIVARLTEEPVTCIPCLGIPW